MPEEIVKTQVRVNAPLWAKLKFVAAKEHRTANAQLEYLIEQCVEQYEAEHGEIQTSPDSN